MLTLDTMTCYQPPDRVDTKLVDLARSGEPVSLLLPSGEYVSLPETMREVLATILAAFAKNQSVCLQMLNTRLPVGEAAALLGLSRGELWAELIMGDEQQRMPIEDNKEKGSTVALKDVLDYQKRESERRRAALDELTTLSQELGLYDLEPS